MFQATSIGSFASQQLSSDQNLSIMGKTSRGCFLQTSSAWTIFLTEEAARGPLTINLPHGVINPIKQAATQAVRLQKDTLIFSDAVHLSLRDAAIWQTPVPVRPFLPAAIRQKTITETIRSIMNRKAEGGLTGILPDLFPLLAPASPPKKTGGMFTGKLHQLQTSLRTLDDTTLPRHLAAFLGQGSGLTPSGDDFLLGFFLTLQRWGENLPLAAAMLPWGQEIVDEANQKTTHLSANLIECAVAGQADQRLILALDGIMTSTNCKLEWLNGIMAWGSSSGLDALAGMILASDPHLVLNI